MVDAIISPLLEQLISMAVEEAKEQVRLVTGVGKEVKKLTSSLRVIEAVLHDAEKRQVKEETVRLWLDQLRCTCYDMEDVLGEWNTARLKLQIDGVDDDHGNDALAPKKKVCSFFPTASCFGCKRLVLRRDIALKLKEINESLDDIAKQKEMFGFAVNVTNERADQRVPSISSIDESEIFGRQKEKKELVERLLCKGSKEQKGPSIISLVGMGGIGKTTLAQFAYNNGDVEKNFKKRIWVCVSDPFDEFRIARAIIESLTDSAPNVGEFQSLMQHIQKYVVEGEKFLLVLDDVWNEDYSKWEPFYNCLKSGPHGSKILITTRKDKVARCMKSTNVISVNVLSEIECWSVFEQLAFFDRSKEECEKLETIGRQIVRKCKGLPLAAKTIASLLQSRNTEKEWQNILESEIWELEEVERGLSAPLLLSYNELPSKVKQCFTYCAIFPKDYSIRKEELINLWMAQGYLSEKGAKEMEDTGEEYFNILASRSFFQDFDKGDDGEIYKCKMHDIVHDFAQYLCRNECLTVEVHSGEELAINSFGEKKILHLLLTLRRGASVPISNIWGNVKGLRGLRSLLVESEEYLWPNEVLRQLFEKLTCLRALKLEVREPWLCKNFIKEIPTNIEKLIHLKYLSLCGQREIEKLPETLCELYNLERLNVSDCENLRELPQGIGRLRELMYLDNAGTASLRYLPVGIGELISLRRVTKFIVGGGYGRAYSLGSLKKLNLLRQCSIRGLGYVSDAGEARRAELEKKKNLFDLQLRFDQLRDGDEEQAVRRENEEDEDERLLEALGPPPNLKKLGITKYRGRRNVVPINWVMSLTNLRVLRLHFCRNCEHLPPLGKLQSLESLYIYGMPSVKRVGNEFLGVESDTDGSSVIAFPRLKELKFRNMEELEEWDLGTVIKEEIIIMPRLSSLQILKCPKLKAMPDHLLQKTTLQSLTIYGCPILEERYREETGEDWPMIRHIPDIYIP